MWLPGAAQEFFGNVPRAGSPALFGSQLAPGYILPVGWLVLAAAIARARQFNLKPGVTLAHMPLHFFKCAPGYPDLSVMYGWDLVGKGPPPKVTS